jgi:hypothetical protein
MAQQVRERSLPDELAGYNPAKQSRRFGILGGQWRLVGWPPKSTDLGSGDVQAPGPALEVRPIFRASA